MANNGSESPWRLRIARAFRRAPEEERASQGEKWFRQEYLCEFVERKGAVFSREILDAAYDDFEGLSL